jgi:alpha-D-xyloside xylohydrolase
MKRSFLVLLLSIFLLGELLAQQGRVQLFVGQSKMDIQFFTPTIVRIRISPTPQQSSKRSLIVTAVPAEVQTTRTERSGKITLSSYDATVVIDKATGAIEFLNGAGKKVLAAAGRDPRSFDARRIASEDVYAIRQQFSISADEALYGLGQFEDKAMNFRGHEVLIAQANRIAVNPFLVSTNGYGILWDNYSMSRFVGRDRLLCRCLAGDG